jgi:tRNA-splicing ligase RtcB
MAMIVKDNMAIFGTHDDNTIEQLEGVAERAVKAALMADGHHGYWMPIGGVAAFRDMISPKGVGVDIACGNCAIKTDMRHDDLKARDLPKIAADIAKHIQFGVGKVNDEPDAPKDHPLFDNLGWHILPMGAERIKIKQLARDQIGTVGSGNHYVDVFVDEDGCVWIGAHFGSRKFGYDICQGFTSLISTGRWSHKGTVTEDNPGALVSLNNWIGQGYLTMMNIAGEYAYAGREWVVRKVLAILGANEVDMVHNHHNFAWREIQYMPDTEQDEDVVVIRKGATPAFPGEKGFVGGSMGDQSVILEGAQGEEDYKADIFEKQMFSTVHGAGRVMSRNEARGKINRKTGEIKSPGKVSPEMMHEWLDKMGVVLHGGGLDESPHAYRRLPEVLEAQEGTINILHTLTPIIVVME